MTPYRPGHILYTWIEQQKANFAFLSVTHVRSLQKLGVEFPHAKQSALGFSNTAKERYSSTPPIVHTNPPPKKHEPEDWEMNILEKE